MCTKNIQIFTEGVNSHGEHESDNNGKWLCLDLEIQ